MGQTVQVDELEAGVRAPVLSGLAESVCPAGSRKGQSLPVRGVSRHKHLCLSALVSSRRHWRPMESETDVWSYNESHTEH